MTLLAEQMNTVTVSKFRLSLEKMKISFTRGLSRMFSIFLDRSLINQTALLRARIVVFSRLRKKSFAIVKIAAMDTITTTYVRSRLLSVFELR